MFHFLVTRKVLNSGYIIVLVMTNFICSMPVPPPKRDVRNIETNGFADSPKVLEIQLPLKIATKEDLVAWARYVMGLMASRINITLTTLKDAPTKMIDRLNDQKSQAPSPKTTTTSPKRVENTKPKTNSDNQNSGFRDPSTIDLTTLLAASKLQEDSPFLTEFTNFDAGNIYEQKENDIFKNSDVIGLPPTGTYFPLPVKATIGSSYLDESILSRYYYSGTGNSTATFDLKPPRIEQSNNKLHVFNDKVENPSPIKINNLTIKPNLTNSSRPILSVPFEAVITITRDNPTEQKSTTAKPKDEDYFSLPIRDPPDDFPPYFEKNFTLTNESGQINVVLQDPGQDFDEKEKNRNTKQKKESSKKEQNKKDRKRQSSTISELLKMLGVLRKNPRNSTEINVAPPIASILRSPTQQQRGQKVQNYPPSYGPPPQRPNSRQRRNETNSAQELENDTDYDDEEEEGGSLQALFDLLPLIVPILEDVSDPESDTDLAELLQAALPLLEGLSEGDEDSPPAIDVQGMLIPILQNLSAGRDGQGSDIGAILGPLIQIIAPLIGPVIGPLIGPLSQSSSNPGEGGGSGDSFGALAQASLGPLLQPGPDGVAPLSTLVAGIISQLSQNSGGKGSDVQGLVSGVVSGVVAGASAGLSSQKKPPRDNSYAPTSYGGYGPVPANSVSPFSLIGMSIKDIFSAGLQLTTTLISAVTGILGASSKDSNSYGPPQKYGPPQQYGPPQKYGPPPTSSPYATGNRAPQRQTRVQTRKP